ncbi:hypothetical protein MHYP_G00166800 [Metynnis hypsauchen]
MINSERSLMEMAPSPAALLNGPMTIIDSDSALKAHDPWEPAGETPFIRQRPISENLYKVLRVSLISLISDTSSVFGGQQQGCVWPAGDMHVGPQIGSHDVVTKMDGGEGKVKTYHWPFRKKERRHWAGKQKEGNQMMAMDATC